MTEKVEVEGEGEGALSLDGGEGQVFWNDRAERAWKGKGREQRNLEGCGVGGGPTADRMYTDRIRYERPEMHLRKTNLAVLRGPRAQIGKSPCTSSTEISCACACGGLNLTMNQGRYLSIFFSGGSGCLFGFFCFVFLSPRCRFTLLCEISLFLFIFSSLMS